MDFIKPMLADHAKDWGVKLGDKRYVLQPKVDGWRYQLHIDGKPQGMYSRRNRLDSLGEPGARWIKEYKWNRKIKRAVLDVEVYTGNGANMDGTEVARALKSGRVKLAVLDILHLNNESFVKSRRWEDRYAILDDLIPEFAVFATDDHAGLYKKWVTEGGGEGVMFVKRDGLYLPGIRGNSWLKDKPLFSVEVVILGIRSETKYVTGMAALEFGFYDKKTKKFFVIGHGSNGLPRGTAASLKKYIGRVAELYCNGMTEGSGSLKSHRFFRWRPDKAAKDCVMPNG